MWYRLAKTIIAGRKEVEAIIGTENYNRVLGVTSEQKYQTTVAYFLKKGVGDQALSDFVRTLKQIDRLKAITINASARGVNFNGNTYTEWIPFTEAVDGLYTSVKSKLDKREQKEISPEDPTQNGVIKVVPIMNVSDAVKYGSGTTWCVTKPGNTMYQSYRDSAWSTFYFVFDGTRPNNDPLSKVAIDIQKGGKISLTDLNNRTGTIAEFGENAEAYMNYLSSKGVNISQFVNRPKTEQEEAEDILLGKAKIQPGWFESLSPEYKSKYIGRGHPLSFAQFKHLVDSNQKELLNQYVGTGESIPPQFLDLIKNRQGLINTYNRAMIIRNEDEIKTLEESTDENSMWPVSYLLDKYASEPNFFMFDLAMQKSKDIGMKTIRYNFDASDQYMIDHMVKSGFEQNVPWDHAMSKNTEAWFVKKYLNKLRPASILSKCGSLPEDLIEEVLNKTKQQGPQGPLGKKYILIDAWENILLKNKLSEPFLDKHIGEIIESSGGRYLSKFQTLSEEFMEKHKDTLDWRVISMHQKMSPEFIRKMRPYIDYTGFMHRDPKNLDVPMIAEVIRTMGGAEKRDFFDEISMNRFLQEDIIDAFIKDMNWYAISRNHELSPEFLKKYARYINYNGYLANNSDEFDDLMLSMLPYIDSDFVNLKIDRANQTLKWEDREYD